MYKTTPKIKQPKSMYSFSLLIEEVDDGAGVVDRDGDGDGDGDEDERRTGRGLGVAAAFYSGMR